MARYYYEARNKKGRAVTGEMSAVSEEELYQKLKTEGKYLIDARDMQESRTYHQLSPLILSEFNRELSDMLGAGVPLVRCLTILSQEETRKKKDREILTGVLKAVRQGEALSDAMEQQKGAFPALMIHMYRAAENGGNLGGTAMRLSLHYEKEHHLDTRIKGAVTYPKILAVMSVLMVIFIMSFILPQLSDLFDNMSQLPLPTRILFGISDFIGTHGIGLLAVLIILVLLFLLLFRIPAVRRKRDEWKLKIPVAGKLLSVIYTARFARSLSSLYRSGLPIVNAMQIARRTIGNSYIEGQFDEVISLLKEGHCLSEAVDHIDGFRKKLSSVIRVGEESGDMAVMLDSLADAFDYESEMATGRLISYLEPALIICMAVIIGFIMIAVMMPIYDSYSAIGTSVYY